MSTYDYRSILGQLPNDLASNTPVSKVSNTVTTSSLQQARSVVNTRLTSYIAANSPKRNTIPGILAGQVTNNVKNKATVQINKTLSVDGIMDTLGIATNSPIKDTHPKIWNNGMTAANGVVSDIRAGKSSSDIMAVRSEPLSLMKYTADASPIRSSIGSTEPQATNTRYTPYAMDLFKLAPKHKFMFVCEFIFSGGYDFVGQGTARKNEFATIIANFERPKIKYDYEDNVNYYNFRTKVPKRVMHDPLSIKFLDDRKNLAMSFFYKYMRATHPITRVDPASSALFEQNGMNFSNKNLLSASYTSLPNDGTNTMNILKEIRVYHLYDFGAKMNIYHFTNPKVLSVALDNWSMEESEGNTIVGEFSYDSVAMELGVSVSVQNSNTISTLSNTGTYSLHPNTGGIHNQDSQTSSNPLGDFSPTIRR